MYINNFHEDKVLNNLFLKKGKNKIEKKTYKWLISHR